MAEVLNSMASLVGEMLHVFGQVRQQTGGASMSQTMTLANQSGEVDSDQTQVTVTRNSVGNYTITINNAMVTGTTNAIALACACTTGAGMFCWVNDVSASSNALSFVVQTSTTSNGNDCSFNFMVEAYTPL